MNDRELLELAARAAGFKIKPHPNRKISENFMFVYGNMNWNPLNDDGDALRLAVMLHMRVEIYPARTVVTYYDPDGGIGEIEQGIDDDRKWSDAEITRRAIVHAAAAIGEDM